MCVFFCVQVGCEDDVVLVDGPQGPEERRFMLHYSFPPFCTGEVRATSYFGTACSAAARLTVGHCLLHCWQIDRLREPSRREIGHGALAQRALEPVMPEMGVDSSWPFPVRVNAETLASNGSSSMVCVEQMCTAAALDFRGLLHCME